MEYFDGTHVIRVTVCETHPRIQFEAAPAALDGQLLGPFEPWEPADAEEHRDALEAALVAALGRSGHHLSITDSAGKTLAWGRTIRFSLPPGEYTVHMETPDA